MEGKKTHLRFAFEILVTGFVLRVSTNCPDLHSDFKATFIAHETGLVQMESYKSIGSE